LPSRGLVAGEGTDSAPVDALKRVIGHLPKEICSDSAERKAVFARVSKQRATSQSRGLTRVVVIPQAGSKLEQDFPYKIPGSLGLIVLRH